LGEKEESAGTVSIRPRQGNQMQGFAVEEAVTFIRNKIEAKELL
jgi:threonyl-tRNA synthetase